MMETRASTGDRPTIFALATPPGRSGIAIFRLSGPGAGPALLALTGKIPPPRQARPSSFRSESAGEIDRGLALWFPAPQSYTGEDMAELHLHGGPAILAAMASALLALGHRPAEPGEFTKRAFENGKLDLVEIEGLSDLLAAETEAQRRLALSQLKGDLSDLYSEWRRRWLDLLAHLEATIDFPEEDVPNDWRRAIGEGIGALAAEIARHLDDDRKGEILRDGFTIVILGPPNVGKSSLLNRLAGREATIVSARAGTTRDPIEIHLDIGGYPIVLVDTAGLRKSDDEIEAEGVARALQRAAAADLTLILFERGLFEKESDLPVDLEARPEAWIDERSLLVLNKIDCANDGPLPERIAGRDFLPISARSGAGIEALLSAIGARAAARLAPAGEGPLLTRARHRAALGEALSALRKAESISVTELGAAELAAEELRRGAAALGRIVGTLDVEEVLDRLFASFCIGK